jgi:hypothetical protein
MYSSDEKLRINDYGAIDFDFLSLNQVETTKLNIKDQHNVNTNIKSMVTFHPQP